MFTGQLNSDSQRFLILTQLYSPALSSFLNNTVLTTEFLC